MLHGLCLLLKLLLLQAMDLDETDVYTMSRLARMALKTGYLQISKLYFEKCLKRNPNHWPSMEGLLRVFCSASNVVEAYGWASQCNRKDPRNTLYVDVLRAIRERFKSTLPYLDTIFIVPPAVNFQAEEKKRPLEAALATFDELFTAKPAYEPPDFTIMPDILKQELKMDDVSFETIGNMLIKLNDKMEELDLVRFLQVTLLLVSPMKSSILSTIIPNDCSDAFSCWRPTHSFANVTRKRAKRWKRLLRTLQLLSKVSMILS